MCKQGIIFSKFVTIRFPGRLYRNYTNPSWNFKNSIVSCKFTSLPKISTCISRTRYQAKSFSNLLPSDFLEGFPETTQILPETTQIFHENVKNTTQFHKNKQQETNNVISKFTSLPKISTCVSRTRHQSIGFSGRLSWNYTNLSWNFKNSTQSHKHKQHQENNNVICKFTSQPNISINRARHQAKKISNFLPSDFLEGFPETKQILPENFKNTTQFHKNKQQETNNFISKFTSLPKISATSTCVSRTSHQAKSFSNLLPSDFLEGFPETTQFLPEILKNTTQFHKHKQQETNNVISKFTNLTKISTCVSRTRHETNFF